MNGEESGIEFKRVFFLSFFLNYQGKMLHKSTDENCKQLHSTE